MKNNLLKFHYKPWLMAILGLFYLSSPLQSLAAANSAERIYKEQQEITVSGTVTSAEDGSAIPGVNVLVQGSTTGTVTDIDGIYRLSVEETATLVFSAIGFTTQEVPVNGRSVIDISLAPDVQQLSEVVVTGYTTQRKRDITGAVTVVDAEEMNKIKAPSFAEKLAGRATGVTISTNGSPGGGTNIRVRGISSINGNNDPLIIIDGIQLQGDKALTGLNPNDIESMQILKDASAASIYGARASAGVIIITTKKGRPGKIQVTYDGYWGSQAPVGGYNDFMIKDPKDFARYQMQKDAGMLDFYGGDINNPVIPEYFYAEGVTITPGVPVDESAYSYPDNLIMKSNQNGTDWWDEIFDPASITEHYIGLSGGSENATFSTSVGYLKQNGTMINTFFERFSARINSTFKAGKFTFGESISLTRSEAVYQQGGNGSEQNALSQTFLINSIVPVYDIGGNFAGAKQGGFSNAKNPVAFAEYNKHDVDVDHRILANVFGEYDILESLKFRTSFSGDLRDNFQPRVNYPRFEDREVNPNNNYQEQRQTNFNWMWTNTLEFSKKFADLHALKVLVGYEAVKQNFRQLNGSVNNLAFINPEARYLNLAYSSFASMGSQERINTLLSEFAQLNYEFNDKYLLSGTIRRDRSSEFTEDNRTGYFPAVSVGWRLSNESFMEGIAFIDDLKIRAGWGVTGNQVIPSAYNSFDRWGGRNTWDATYDITGGNTSAVVGYTLYQYGDPNTQWEEAKSQNIGLDAFLFNGKISLVFDLYKRDIDKLIFQPTLPGAAGNSTAAFSNIASMTNKGFDLGIGYNGVITSDLDFNVNLNISKYKNEITDLGESPSFFPAGIDKRFGEVNVWEVGSPISSFYGYTNVGLFQTDAEAAASGQTGAKKGGIKRADLSGPEGVPDGVINDYDKGVIGNPHPDFTAGLNIGLNYRNFDFSMFLFASVGNDIYNYNRVFTHFGQFGSNVSTEVLTDSWSETNPNGSLPAINSIDANTTASSDFYVEDGSYLRAQNISLGYTLPSGMLGIQSLRFYVQVQNAFTITDYSGIDPAISSVNNGQNINGQNQNDGWMGYDLSNYPSSRTFMFGVNASF